MTYTLARLRVPRAVWDLIADKLRAAGYDHVFQGGTIDMTHIGLEVDPAEPALLACRAPAAVEIRPLGDASPDNYTHACAAHVVDLFGVRDGEPEPPAYEVRELAPGEVAGPPALVCCYLAPAADLRSLTASMDNVLAWRLGEACNAAAAERRIGDLIDRGLVLLRELTARGFDLRERLGGRVVTIMAEALVDRGVLAGERWIYSRIPAGVGRFEAWQFRVIGGETLETRFYNPDRESADGFAVGWRPWRPATPIGPVQLRQPASIIAPTEAAP